MEKNLYNLTNPQKSIWLMDQVNPGTNLNNIGGPVLINDSVNVPLLEKALNLYIEKNEATRLRIKLVDSSPMQYVADYSYFTIPVTKLKNEKELEDWNQKIIDTQRVINYINSFLDNVRVEDIIQNSGADKLRVYPALFELEQSGFLEVVEREELGAPLIVRKRKNG